MRRLALLLCACALVYNCSNTTKEANNETTNDSLKTTADTIVETKDTKNNAPLENEMAITETLLLLEGHSSEDGGTVTFKTEDGKERLSWTVPEGAVEWNETEVGADIKDAYLNKKYKVTYTMKKTFHDPSQTWETRMDITQMVKL